MAMHAYLYDSTLQPVGPLGIVVRLHGGTDLGRFPKEFDAAFFSPWPAALAAGAEFAVRTESEDGAATRWRMPQEVFDLRAVTKKGDSNVAIVILERTGVPAPPVVAGGGSLSHSKGIEEHGILEELKRHSPTFDALGTEAAAQQNLSALPGADGGPATAQLAIPTYTRTVGVPGNLSLNRSLCRILHWD
ncbi:hypothetical protein [Cellulomonas sp. URHD0024]|uniref:hypothetical protein n=1 Tax=Cellulomonas sp. URHD0024 TaxID=1302620 RepID=UPI0012DCC9DC|nr:hypothetical protein [Cellulomonas sp. URHD0024]